MLAYVGTQIAGVTEAGVALWTHKGLLPAVSPHVVLQGSALTEALHALVTSVGLLPAVSPHVVLQGSALIEALHAVVTSVGPLPGVNPHVDLQVAVPLEALQAMVTSVGFIAGVGTHVDYQLVIFGKHLATYDTGMVLASAPRPSPLLTVLTLATVQALGPAVVRRQQAQGLQFGCGEEGVMAVHHQWALPFSVDAQDPQFPIVIGHVGGASGVHTQTL